MIIVMSNFYIFKSGRLSRKNNSLQFINEDIKKDIPIKTVSDIYLFSKMDFNTDLTSFICSNSINLHIIDFYGNYKGSFLNNKKKSGLFKIKQVQSFLDKESRIEIAKSFIKSSKFTMIKNLEKYNLETDGITKYNFENVNSIEHLMGIEGNIRREYYKKYSDIVKPFKFNGRNKRPPKDEVNTLISFGNVLCYSECMRAINQTILDDSISFLHSPSDSRSSLSLDLAEIFKPLYVDRVVFKLINDKMIKDKHFIKEDGKCYLNESGKKILTKEWDNKLKVTIYHKKLKRKVSYKTLIRLECYKLIKHINEGVPYDYLKFWW